MNINMKPTSRYATLRPAMSLHAPSAALWGICQIKQSIDNQTNNITNTPKAMKKTHHAKWGMYTILIDAELPSLTRNGLLLQRIGVYKGVVLYIVY